MAGPLQEYDSSTCARRAPGSTRPALCPLHFRPCVAPGPAVLASLDLSREARRVSWPCISVITQCVSSVLVFSAAMTPFECQHHACTWCMHVSFCPDGLASSMIPDGALCHLLLATVAGERVLHVACSVTQVSGAREPRGFEDQRR